jgi:hypothetical protein
MATEQQRPDQGDDAADRSENAGRVAALDRSDESQDFVDPSKIDFDPDDGVYSGTAVDGTSEIPGPHLDGDSGELSAEDLKREAEKEMKEHDVDPGETPAAKSPVAKAAEQEREGTHDSTDGDRSG